MSAVSSNACIKYFDIFCVLYKNVIILYFYFYYFIVICHTTLKSIKKHIYCLNFVEKKSLLRINSDKAYGDY